MKKLIELALTEFPKQPRRKFLKEPSDYFGNRILKENVYKLHYVLRKDPPSCSKYKISKDSKYTHFSGDLIQKVC